MCGSHCITFIDYILVGKTLFDFTNISSPSDYKRNDKIKKDKYVKYRI